MSLDNSITSLKNCLRKNNIEYDKILLFGSRAENTFDIKSDYDICILLNKSINNKVKSEISNRIYNELLIDNTLLPLDLIIKNKDEFIEESSIENTFSWKIKRYGITL